MEQKTDDGHRERGRNFTEKEKEIAITIIDRYRHTVENKATDGASLKRRKHAWQKVAEEYNATAVSAPRTAKQLKILWSNLRRIAKKTVAEENKKKYLDQEDELDEDLEVLKKRKIQDEKNRYRIGGGQYKPQLSEVGARVLAMVEPQARRLSNVYDDDHVCHGDVTLSSTRGAVLTTPIPRPTSLNLEPIAGSSHASTNSDSEFDMEDPFEDPASEIILSKPIEPGAIPEVRRKKYIPPKQKTKKTKKTTPQLKRILYLKHIQLANMEIKFKNKMYELELKIKQKELDRLVNN